MWTPVKAVIQEESTEDMGLVTGIVEVRVVLPGARVAAWVA